MGAIFSPTHQLLVLSLVLLVINPAKIGASKKLTIRKLEKFNEDSDEVHSHLRIAEDEENLLKVSGKLNTHVDIDNHWKISVKVMKAASPDDDFHEVLKLQKLGVCDAMKTYYKDFFYEKLKKYSNAPRPEKCPLPADDYHLDDYPLDVKIIKKLLSPGYYQIVCKLRKGDDVKLEYRAEIEME
ncbi:uncharacterized protein Dana_GF17596 [Drosophila ananassae]|uniref:MD-2-related lipid-recognition domain-containing protein n=1 Tax=Drosophila ananassae TaxID=7217 RepID=B3LX73_DROAN|nr:uncharacterized protein LOC6500380 [Drosophila ananassae]EDV41673.1 uncharacterized protein Dana_GF17596 [Drosophila ananassae]